MQTTAFLRDRKGYIRRGPWLVQEFSVRPTRLCSYLFASNNKVFCHSCSGLLKLSYLSFSVECGLSTRSTHNIRPTTKFLSAEERFMFGIAMLFPGPVPLHHSANWTQWTASGSRVWENERFRRTRENWNVESDRFILVKESFLRTDSVANDPSLARVSGCRKGSWDGI